MTWRPCFLWKLFSFAYVHLFERKNKIFVPPGFFWIHNLGAKCVWLITHFSAKFSANENFKANSIITLQIKNLCKKSWSIFFCKKIQTIYQNLTQKKREVPLSSITEQIELLFQKIVLFWPMKHFKAQNLITLSKTLSIDFYEH